MDDSSSEDSESSSDPPSEYFRAAYCLRIRPQYFHVPRLCQNLSRCSAWQARVLLRFEITVIEALLGSIALSHRILLFSTEQEWFALGVASRETHLCLTFALHLDS